MDHDAAVELAANALNDSVQHTAQRLRRAGCDDATIYTTLTQAMEFLANHLDDDTT